MECRTTVLAPAAFVLLWSTGFIGAKLGLAYAAPMTFLALRFGCAAALLAAIALVLRPTWPSSIRGLGKLALAGGLLHAVYLGGVFAALHHGLEAGVTALIVGIQPVVVVTITRLLFGAVFLGRQYVGAGLGCLGVGLVVWNKLAGGLGTAEGVALAIVALFGISLGTVYQQRWCRDMDPIGGGLIQFLAGFVLVGGLALATGEAPEIEWSWGFIATMAYLVVVLSVGSILLFYYLLRRGTAHSVSSLLFLVPPTTAVLANILFGETLSPMAVAGMILAVVGVFLVSDDRRKTAIPNR